VIPTRSGEDLYFDHASGCWRMYNYITGASSFDEIDSPERFRRAGGAFGEFAMLLSDLPGESLSETIPDFHNTAKRYEAFLSAVEEDRFSRAASALSEIEFLKNRCAEMSVLVDLASSGELPVRVTHNDTKLNNVLFDDVTGETVCVVDLDTVMPGLSLYDFGDSIRYGANTAAEDEKDLSKVAVSPQMYEAFTEGYLSQAGSVLNKKELELLPFSAKLLTMECGMRFLTDWLSGDTYFSTAYAGHNLVRAKCQLALAADMERNMTELEKITELVIGAA
ncbi:MAG: aminoglycoside phosphotransferase family protein, partial [Clostridia bacterium]|nr:aminoglycoside phosphotransferase family protein [Clostridia bacterium]